MGQHQWYVHLSRLDGADMGVIKSAVQQLRKDCADKGINLVIGPENMQNPLIPWAFHDTAASL